MPGADSQAELSGRLLPSGPTRPRPGEVLGLRAPEHRGSLLDAQKGTEEPPKPRFWIPWSQSVFIKFGTSLPLNFVFYLIYSGSIDDTSAAALLKGDMFR